MANVPQYIKDLAVVSGKSEQAVTTAIDNTEKEMSTSPKKKAYETAQGNMKEKKYEEYWGEVMLKVRTKLGMKNPKINIPESVIEEVEDLVRKAIRIKYNIQESVMKESEEMVKVWVDFSFTDRSGYVDYDISKTQRYDFEEAFGAEFGEVPEETDYDDAKVEYVMTRTQYEWCEKNFETYFILDPEVIIKEDGEGAVAAVTTSNMGGATTASGEKAPYGSSAIYAQRMGMVSRAGSIGMPKKKKKKIRESIEYIDSLIG